MTRLAAWKRRAPWVFELLAALVWLAIGALLMPVLIFYAGEASLGRYEGASVQSIFTSIYMTLGEPSWASWSIILGPYVLFLLFRLLIVTWRASAKPT